MSKKFVKNIILFAVATIIAVLAIFAVNTSNAYAWTTTEWRPSVEINKDIVATNEKITQANVDYQDSLNFISDYEEDGHVYEEKVNELQSKMDDMQNYIKYERPELEEVTKNSYAAFFAKGLLDEIVGSRIVTEGIFHWGLVTFIACAEDDEILSFVEDYYNTQSELNEAKYDMENAAVKYENTKIFVANFPAQIQSLNDHLAHINALLPEIYEIESVYGAAGESRIEGDNVFCNPCPGSTLSSPFGEERDGYVHHGADLCAPEGTPIYAACDGVVFESGTNDSMGNYIKIDHGNGLVTVYMHCSQVFVPAGVSVCKGDNIALVGTTGDSEGPHLHFQVELYGTPVNGLDYL